MQARPPQHWAVVVQACPVPVQLLVPQVPLVEAGGMLHAYPVQQSPVLVHTPPCGWQAIGVWQVPEPTPPSVPRQRCEQQSFPTVQAVPLAWHTPASGVPASAVPASGGGGRMVWQAFTPVSVVRQSVPEQHSVESLHVVPTVLQVPTVQTSLPPGPGTHGAPPQHWSLNWHSLPGAMQQGASPVYPVGHAVDAPPKQRGMPETSSLQTSLPGPTCPPFETCPLQQSMGALVLPPSGSTGAPQMLPTGLQALP